MERPFPAYTGDDPYIFVSYSHEDSDVVFPEIQWLKDQDCNIWYDEGIVPGSEWTEELGKAIEEADRFLFFITPNSVASQYCRDELSFALNHKKKTLIVYLDKTDLPVGLELSIGTRQAILKHELREQDYRDKLLASIAGDIHIDTPARSANGKQISIAAVLAIALLVSMGGWFLYISIGSESAIEEPGTESESPANDPSGPVTPAPGQEQRPGIAVLPFLNMSDDPSNEYFSDGISEEILNALVKTNQLPVIARTSSFQFRGQNLPVQKIGDQLNVSHLLEGSVRRSGNLVRVTAQLIDTASGTHLWSERYDGAITDIFALQDEIVGKVVAQVGIALGRDASQLVSEQRGRANAEAYELYLQALYFSNSGNPYEVEKAIPLFEQAVALDPEFADAWAELGATYFFLNSSLNIPIQTNPIAIKAFGRALAIDPQHAGAMFLLGVLRITHDYAWREGFRLMAQAAALAPQHAGIQGGYGRWLRMTRHEEADTIMARASRFDPLAFGPIIDRAAMMVHEGRFDEGVELMETALIQHRDKYQANVSVALFNWAARRFDRAEEYLERARAIVGSDFASIRLLEWKIAAARGDLALANGIKAEVKERAKHTRVAHLVDASGPWTQSEYLEMFELAIEQRHGEVLIPLLYERHWMVAKSDWDRLQNSVRFTDVQFGDAVALGASFSRSNQEREELLSSATPMSNETLQSYTGTFQRPNGGQRRVVRDGNQLKYIKPSGDLYLMIPNGSHRFKILEYRATVEFILENGEVRVMRWIERELTVDAVKVDTPNLR